MVPYDATKHIQGIGAGLSDAMPHLVKAGEANQPGDPTAEEYINKWEARVAAGQDPKSATEELAAEWETKIKGGHGVSAPPVSSVGFNNDQPSLGPPGGIAQPVSQAPDSFAQPGSFNGMTPSASTMGAGIGGAQPPQSAPTAPPPQVNYTEQGAMPADNMGASVTGEKVASPPGSAPSSAPSKYLGMGGKPIPYNEPKIDLTAGRDISKMQTQTGGKIPNMRTRGEQDRAMSNIERIKKMENADGNLEFKQKKLEMESKVKILKGMSDRLTAEDKMEIMAKMKAAGENLDAQIAVMDATIKLKALEIKDRLGKENLRIKDKGASQKLDPRLKHLHDRYKSAKGELSTYQNSLLAGEKPNKEKIKQLRRILTNEMHEYNKAAIELDIPTITDADNPVPEAFVKPEDRTALPEGEE